MRVIGKILQVMLRVAGFLLKVLLMGLRGFLVMFLLVARLVLAMVRIGTP